MPWTINPDGTATYSDWSDLPDPTRVHATLAGAIVHGGVRASAFDRPVAAQALFDGPLWLSTGEMIQTGLEAHYRVEATPESGLIHPPRRPVDLPA